VAHGARKVANPCPRAIIFMVISFNRYKLYLADNVVEGVLEPLVEGDVAVAVHVHGLEVLAALSKSSLLIGLMNL
jgi:hypothetical protein